MTEIKSNIFARVGLLKKYFFFECLYFNEDDIGMLFVFWLRNRPSLSTYATGGMDGGSSKMFAGAYRERGVEK